jgi:UDP-glucose 4-epimerase
VRLLVTGGAGFIGSIVSAYLIDQGYEINILDNLSTGRIENIDKRSEFFFGDVTDANSINAAIINCDAVIHLAGSALVVESNLKPEFYMDQNFIGTKNVLESMLQHGLTKIIFSSSCSVYGDTQSSSIIENSPTNPVNPYGKSKLKADLELTKYAINHNFECTSLRFFNVAGAYRSEIGRLFGELHADETHLIPNLLTKPDFTIYGYDLNTKDGTCVRDFVHVTDLAAAVLLSIETKTNEAHRIFNLGSGSGYSVQEVAKVAELVLGRTIKKRYEPKRQGDPLVLISDSSLAREKLGWSSTKDLLCMIEDTWKFFNSL